MKWGNFFLVVLLFILIATNAWICKSVKGEYILNDNLIKQISARVPNYTQIDKIPQNVKNALISVEDKRFYDHHGFDSVGIGRAFIENIKTRKFKQGGSTITQQLAKNLFLSNEKTITRKLKELVLALNLEARYSKEEILEMYLNVIYYGSGAYGIENASQEYFAKHVKDLNLPQAAMLAGLPKAPSIYNPKHSLEKALERQKVVLAAMTNNGYIGKDIEYKLDNKILVGTIGR